MDLKGLFSGLFKTSGEDGELIGTDEEVSERARAEIKLPVIYEGIPVDLMTAKSRLLFSGRMVSYDASHLLLERIPGELSFPVLEEGLDVKLRGYNEEMVPLNFDAKVEKSSAVMCRLNHLLYIPYQNIRHSMRLPLDMKAELYAAEDTRLNQPRPCQVINISTGGACVFSDQNYPLGKAVRLRMELVKGEGWGSYVGEIVRAQEREEGGYEYGVLFAQLRKSQINSLNRDIMTYQKETVRLMQE